MFVQVFSVPYLITHYWRNYKKPVPPSMCVNHSFLYLCTKNINLPFVIKDMKCLLEVYVINLLFV